MASINKRSSPSAYCKIPTFLQHHAETLYYNIQDLCLFGLFSTRKGQGVTFLLPPADIQEKINKTVAKDSGKAAKMIQALTLSQYLPNISDFKKFQEDIPNRLGNKLEIKSVKTGEVILKNGAKITPNKQFKRLYETSHIIIYDISGELPITGEKSQRIPSKRGAKEKTMSNKSGGYTGGSNANIKGLYKSADSKVNLSHFLDKLVAIEAINIDYKQEPEVDILTNTLLDLDWCLNNSESPCYGKYPNEALVVASFKNANPACVFYLMKLMPQDVLREIASGGDHKYDNSAQYAEAYKFEKSIQYHKAMAQLKKEAVESKINDKNVISKVDALYDQSEQYIDEKIKSACQSVSGCTKEWRMSKDDYCVTTSPDVLRFLNSNDIGSLKRVVNQFKSHAINDNPSFILNEDLFKNGENVQAFCGAVTFLQSSSCASMTPSVELMKNECSVWPDGMKFHEVCERILPNQKGGTGYMGQLHKSIGL